MRNVASLISACLLLGPLSGGCALVASRGEYRIYRKIRMAQSPGDQARYLRWYERDYPRGVLASQVARIGRALDERMFEDAREEYTLGAYLRAFPTGAHRSAAEARLEQARLFRERRETARRAQERADRSAALEAEQRRRRWFRGAFLGWVQILSRVTGWNTSLEEFLAANSELANVWREGGAAPTCSGEVCWREFPHDFFIRRTGQTRIDRQAKFVLRIHSAEGKVARIDILVATPGFLSWRELESQNDVLTDDPEQVADARGRAQTALSEMVRTSFSQGQDVGLIGDAQGVLWAFAQNPLLIEIVTTRTEGSEPPGDGLTFRYAPPPPPPPPERTPPRHRRPLRPLEVPEGGEVPDDP